MIAARLRTVGSYTLHPHSASIAAGDFNKPLFPLLLSPTNALCSSIFNSKASLKCCCTKNDVTQKPIKGFSVLSSDCSICTFHWVTEAYQLLPLYWRNRFLICRLNAGSFPTCVFDVRTQWNSVSTSKNIKPQYDLVDFFKDNKISKERNCLLASALGFGFLSLLVFLTSLIGGRLYGVKVVDNPIVKEILLSSNISKTAFVLVDCAITPVLEEAVYRGFLLTSLASTMKWQHAVVLSSAIFSAAHFSIDNFIQLFIIGCILGCSYCWSGNLTSSVIVHSLYNALILILTFCL